jgi:two-component sensor histidine kinase
LHALAQAHALTIPAAPDVTGADLNTTTLHALIRTILAPYDETIADGSRAIVAGPDIPIGGTALTSFALLLHEFATNAAKYGALSTPEGRIKISGQEKGDRFVLTWTESGGPPVHRRTDGEGFGSLLARAAVQGQLGGDITRDWKPKGLSIRLTVDRNRLGG